jgi:hypothetical protein
MPPRSKKTAPAAGAASKKRAAASAPEISDAFQQTKARDEAERFASRVALHLREAAESSGAPWIDDKVKAAFKETVMNMPAGALKEKLSNNLAHFSKIIAEKTSRPTPADLPQLGELGGPDHKEFHELKEQPRYDFSDMSLEELVTETRWGCTSGTQWTHSLKESAWFQPLIL